MKTIKEMVKTFVNESCHCYKCDGIDNSPNESEETDVEAVDGAPDNMLTRLNDEIRLMDDVYGKCISTGDLDSGLVVRMKVMDSLPCWVKTIGDAIDELKRRKSRTDSWNTFWRS